MIDMRRRKEIPRVHDCVGPRIFPDGMIIAEAGRSVWGRDPSRCIPCKASDIARILNGESGLEVFTDFYIGAGLVESYFLSFDEVFGAGVSSGGSANGWSM